jgi:hypothetical protein
MRVIANSVALDSADFTLPADVALAADIVEIDALDDPVA